MAIYRFRPSSTSAFTFQPTLDGQVYTVTVTWNFWGQRYYVNVFDLDQNLVVSIALVGSPSGVDAVNLVAGYFASSTMVYRTADQAFEVLP